MKIEKLANGERALRVTGEEWEALKAAIEIAYDDITVAPKYLRRAGEQLHIDAQECPARTTTPAFAIPFDGEGPTVSFFPFPEYGCFLGVSKDYDGPPHGWVDSLWFCPMNADGTADQDNMGEVENVEGMDLGAVNRFFGSAFETADFYGL